MASKGLTMKAKKQTATAGVVGVVLYPKNSANLRTFFLSVAVVNIFSL